MRPNRIPASFLPDFCGSRTLFVLVLVAELLAISLALARPGYSGDRVQILGLFSLLVQSVAVISAGALCLLQKRIGDLPEPWVAVCSYAATLFISLCVSELAWRLGSDWMSLPDEPPPDHLSFLVRSLGISAIAWALTLRYFYVQHQWRRRMESEADARFQALQSRIRPHFLFNCMNTIAGLTRRSPQLAEEAIEDLADLFRASLRDVQRPDTLREELELCERYLRIEGHRLGERLRVDWRMDGVDRDISLPALILQPLLENAIYHG
ncbi:MAG: sensor histidine kinase, partial [Burkholderiales bacterium]